MTKDIRLGGRGEEMLALLYRFGGLTTAQYYLLAEPRDEVSQYRGSLSAGNPWGRRLAANAGRIRRWVEEGKSDAEIAGRLEVDVTSVRRFCVKRGLREEKIA